MSFKVGPAGTHVVAELTGIRDSFVLRFPVESNGSRTNSHRTNSHRILVFKSAKVAIKMVILSNYFGKHFSCTFTQMLNEQKNINFNKKI